MTNKKHIINKVLFEVNTPDTKTAYYLKDNLDVFFKQSLLPTIQTYFDSITSINNTIIRLDKLELNINSNDVKDELQLQMAIIKELQKKLIHKKDSEFSKEKGAEFLTIDKGKSNTETFLHFLKTGQTPWWDLEIDIKQDAFLSHIIYSKDFRVKLCEILVNNQVRKRLIYQFSNEELLKILGKDNPQVEFPKKLKKRVIRERYWETIMKYLTDKNLKSLQEDLISVFIKLNKKKINKTLTNEIEDVFELKTILNKISSDKTKQEQWLKLKISLIDSLKKMVFKDSLVTLEDGLYNGIRNDARSNIDTGMLQEIIEESVKRTHQTLKELFHTFKEEIVPFTSTVISNKLKELKFNPVKDSKGIINQAFPKEFLEQDSSIYVHNAGLVLLHPYLERLFMELNLLNEERKVKPEKADLAIHLLHFIATKREKQLENNLVFEKFLCGYPMDKPIRKNIRLPQKYKVEAERMLQAVLNNWQALKNTSVDGIRENFIKRSGKLMLDDQSKYRMIVERKTQDILLEKLPWNLNLIKIPWIDKLLFVEW
ncbi:contractile injection system tape measure protein [uncultured Aquimarina sp.]|uniref:contractile injection system tape measure protein n=1 Tax=uncultured Aquimarina sp. TaxID=575652 RepID=UPI002637BF84|nr:contractile injection system tape measure protein [uncultured Aquimarina sp.]